MHPLPCQRRRDPGQTVDGVPRDDAVVQRLSCGASGRCATGTHGSRRARRHCTTTGRIGEDERPGRSPGDPGWRGATSAAQSLDCFSYHSNRSSHRDLLGQQCGACHSNTTWKIVWNACRIAGITRRTRQSRTSYKHPSPAWTVCAQCHQAPPSHYMGHFEMVSKRVAGQQHARVEQCYLCHQTDASNDIRGVGWYTHH